MRSPDPRCSDVVPGLVSVIMATYNCRQFLGPAIASVLGQTYSHLELHIVDDGSTDNTKEEVERFLADPRVHYHHQQNSGQTVAKNHGIRQSRGEFVAFCDADDMWRPHKLALQVPRFAHNGKLGVVYTRASLIDQQGAPVRPDRSDEPHRPSGWVTPYLFTINFIPFGTALVRRQCLDEVGLFNESYQMGIDWELWLRVSLRYEFLFVDVETYVYRVWPGQMSRNWKGRYEHAFRIMSDFTSKHPGLLDPAIKKAATAHSYATRARARAMVSGDYRGGLADLMRALRIDPMFLLAWKTLAMITLRATGVRRS